MADQLTKNQRKGMRHENEARRILNMVYRWASRVTDAYSPKGTTDVFNCADLIAVRRGWPTKFVQVKTNDRPSDSQSWPATFVDNEYTQFEWWSRFDRQGWEIYAYVPSEEMYGGDMELVLELDTSLSESEARDKYSDYLQDRWGIVKNASNSEGDDG